MTLVRSGRGWLTALGRDLQSTTHAKHRIKRVDRFVGNALATRGVGALPRSSADHLPRGTQKETGRDAWGARPILEGVVAYSAG